MNNADKEYFRLLKLVLEKGREKSNRTGVPTIGTFGAQARFDLSEGFPLLTTKKVFLKGIIHELLWFLSGSTNIKYLVDNNVHIWDEWAFARYQKEKPKNGGILLPNNLLLTNQEKRIQKGDIQPDDHVEAIKANISNKQKLFIQRIKDDSKFAEKWGELGEGTYGGMWRGFPYYKLGAVDSLITGEHPKELILGQIYDKKGYVDQIQKVINKLKSNPDDRRLIVSAWHPYWSEKAALAPCHCLFQFHTEELTEVERLELWQKKLGTMPDGRIIAGLPNFEGKDFDKRFDQDGIPRRRLNCQLFQRSADAALGIPFNIASYALLTHMMAQCVNMVAGEFIHSFGDLHIYTPHIPNLKIQMEREPFPLPKLWLNPEVKDLFKFKYEDIKVLGYQCHPKLDFEVAV